MLNYITGVIVCQVGRKYFVLHTLSDGSNRSSLRWWLTQGYVTRFGLHQFECPELGQARELPESERVE